MPKLKMAMHLSRTRSALNFLSAWQLLAGRKCWKSTLIIPHTTTLYASWTEPRLDSTFVKPFNRVCTFAEASCSLPERTDIFDLQYVTGSSDSEAEVIKRPFFHPELLCYITARRRITGFLIVMNTIYQLSHGRALCLTAISKRQEQCCMRDAGAAAVLTASDVPFLETKLRFAEAQLLYGHILSIVIEEAGAIA